MKMGRRFLGIISILISGVIALFLWDRGAVSNPVVSLTPDGAMQDPLDSSYRLVGFVGFFIHRWMGIATYGFPFLLLHIGWRQIRGAAPAELRRRVLILLWFLINMSLVGAAYDRLIGNVQESSGGPFGTLVAGAMAGFVGNFAAACIVLAATWIGVRWSGIATSLGIPPLKIDPEKMASGLVNGFVAAGSFLSRFVRGLVDSTSDERGRRKSLRPATPLRVAAKAQSPKANLPRLTTATEIAPRIKSVSEKPEVADFQPSSSQSVFDLCEKNKRRHSPKKLPPVSILESGLESDVFLEDDSLGAIADAIVGKLREFRAEGEITGHEVGPLVTRYELLLAPGVKISQVRNLSDDLAVALGSSSVRLEIPIPGKNTIGIEIPNSKPSIVLLGDMIRRWKSNSALEFPLGVDVTGKPKFDDIAKMPHLLVAGATNSGKSVFLNALLISLLLKNSTRDLRLILVDVKRTELTPYDGIPHLLCPVLTEPEGASEALEWAVQEMESRYELVTGIQVRNIVEYNEACSHADERIPYLVLVIDELADLMMQSDKELERNIVRLAQKARAVGIHLILATQRPSADVVTGMIKANFPSRIAFHVSSMVDSRVVLDENGAERLVGRGDMLYKSSQGHELIRIHGAFVSNDEVKRITSYWC